MSRASERPGWLPLLLLTASVRCASQQPQPSPSLVTASAAASAARPAVSAPPASPPPPGPTAAQPVAATGTSAESPDLGVPCGELSCLAFRSPEAALEHVLASRPRVLAVGEAHAQKGTEAIASTAQRFALRFLPRLAGRASDLVIELLVANGRCGKNEQRVAAAEKPVTESQVATNQNEFVALGHAAQALGIRPHALTLNCEAAAKIAAAGGEAVARLLEAVASATQSELERLLDAQPHADQLLLAYGGALHNDLRPRPGRETWSYGPALSTRTAGAYAELDLIVPEYVRDSESWRAFPWYAAFAAAPSSENTRLYSASQGSFVLIFPNSK